MKKRLWKLVLLSFVWIYGPCLVAMEKRQDSAELAKIKALTKIVEDRTVLNSSSENLEARTMRDYGCPGMPGAGQLIPDNQDISFHTCFFRNAPQQPFH